MSSLQCNWDNSLSAVAYNDISIDEGGNLRIVSGVDDVQQTVNQSCWMWRGEYDFNVFLGVPYKLILGNPSIQDSLIKLYLTGAILLLNDYLTPEQYADYGINKVLSIIITPNPETRAANTSVIILLNNGQKLNISV